MPRHKILTDEQRKQRKKEYDINYQRHRYETDPEYREKRRMVSRISYAMKDTNNERPIIMYLKNNI